MTNTTYVIDSGYTVKTRATRFKIFTTAAEASQYADGSPLAKPSSRTARLPSGNQGIDFVIYGRL